jgi:hypothetical protein
VQLHTSASDSKVVGNIREQAFCENLFSSSVALLMSQQHHKSAVLSILISFKGTGENQLQQRVGDTPVLSQ